MKSKLWQALALLVALVLLVSPAIAEPRQQPPPPLPQVHEPPRADPGGRGAQVDPMAKLDGELRTLAAKGGDEPVLVYILAAPGVDLSRVAEVTETRPYLDGELVVANVKPAMLNKLASHPDVMAAEAFHAIEAPIALTPREDLERPNRETIREARENAADLKAAGLEGATPRELPGVASPTASGGEVSTQDWNSSDLIGASDAWAKGYTGEGVNIAVLDSGVDFGHPDLEGKQAVYEDGPYAGWPIALDPRSMREYYYNGRNAWNNYYEWEWEEDLTDGEAAYYDDWSWYAGVYDVLRCTDGTAASFEFEPDPIFDPGFLATYTVDPAIVALSKSGEIRWSVHPDVQFVDYFWGDWVPFILLDTATAGAYDTVIVDLNFDLWFDEYDDVANKADPVLNQDLGSYVYTDTVVMTGTQYVPDCFGYPPAWYGPPEVVTSTTTLTAGSWIVALDHNAGPDATDGADGTADVSGGMVYYIADGERPIPGMDYLYAGDPPPWGADVIPLNGHDAIPLNGRLVAFMLGSDYVRGYDHGTLCASAAAAGGEITGYFSAFGEWVQYDPADFSNFPFGNGEVSQAMPWLKPAAEGTVQGPAPGARIIAVGACYDVVNDMQGFFDAYTFLAYGVDGEPNSGDEFVDIVSMSYSDGSVHNDGWDWKSRLISYYNQNYLPNTTFHSSSGSGGPGYGTVSSPQGNSIVSVGASTQYGASDLFGGGLALSQINDGEVQPFSGRGPDGYGRPDPDVVANGAWGAGDTPLNMSPVYHLVYGSPFPGDGNNAWYEWGGTSRSSPEAAGVTALIYQAYKQANGSFPDFETARQILMSSADDLNHDVLMQGAGRVNADRATDVAASLGGVYVSPSLLAAGEYDGTHYESFANVLYPGDTWDQTFTVYNPGAAEATVTVRDEVLMQMDVLTYTVVVSPWTGMEDDSYPNNFYYSADYFVGADPMTTTHGSDLATPVPAGADLMQVQLVVPFEVFDFAYDDPDPYSVSYSRSQLWSLTVYDWEDRNGNGKLWEDNSGDGIVNPGDWGDEVDIAWTGPTTRTEINRFAYSYLYGNEQEVTVRLGDRADVNDIVIGIVHLMPNDTRWFYTDGITDTVKTMEFYQENPFQVKVIFYEKADWDLVDESTASLSVPAGGSATFDATFDIPADQPPGLYEGAITVDDGTHASIIPTTVNVAVPDDELLFTLGGTDPAGTPYDNGRGYGAWTWYNALEEGDWRFFYYDADAGFEQQYLYVRNQWGERCENMPTAYETLVWGPNPGDQFSQMEPDKFGPYGMQFAGGTWGAYGQQYGPYMPRRGDWWFDGDFEPLPETRVWASLWDGLNQVQFRQILASGKEACGEGFEATAGVFGVDAPGWREDGIHIDTEDFSGSFTVDAVSPVDALGAYASGFGQEEWFRNQDVSQGKDYALWPEDLMEGWVYTFEVTNTDEIVVETFGPWSSDIDLYLMYDANGDGVFSLYDDREALAYSYTGGPEEHIYYWGNFNSGYWVQDGTYAVVMYGWEVMAGDQFDLRLTLYGGDDLSIEGANPDNNYVLSVTPGDPETLTVNWEVPGSGLWYGHLRFSMPLEEPQYWYMGPGFYVPVTINVNAVHAGATKTVDREMVCASRGGDHEILTYNITMTNSGNEDTYLEVADLLPEHTIYYYSYRPSSTEYPGSYVAYWWDDTGRYGYFNPDRDGYLRLEGDLGPSKSGKVYIEYKVKVEAGFVGDIVNSADITVLYPYHDFFSRTATTEVRYCLRLLTIRKNYP